MTKRMNRAGLAAMVGALIVAAPGLAQGPGGPPPMGGPGGPPPMGGPGGGRPGFQRRALTAADVPAEVLGSALKLSADQRAKVGKAHEAYRASMMGLFRPGADRGGPPTPQQMTGIGKKMSALSAAANKKLAAILTPAQRTALPALVKRISMFRRVGLPAEALTELKLTPDQLARIEKIAAAAREPGPFGGGPGMGRAPGMAPGVPNRRGGGMGGPGGPAMRPGGMGGPGGPAMRPGGMGGPGGPGMRPGGMGGPGGPGMRPGGMGGPGGPGGFGGFQRQPSPEQLAVAKILTPAQRSTLDKIRERRRGMGGPGGPGGFGGRPGGMGGFGGPGGPGGPGGRPR